MILIIKSLVIVLAVSTALGLISHYTLNISFIGTFSIVTVIQLIGSYFFNTWLDSRNSNAVADREADLVKEFNRQGTQVPCAYCGETNFIPIRTDVPNDFECGNCQEQNAVYISITAAQRTNPIQSSPLEVLSYNTQLESAKDKILNNEEDGE